MDQTDIDRCNFFAALVLGRAPKPGELDSLVDKSTSFADFRVRMVLSDSFSSVFAIIANHWRMVVPKKAGVPSRSLGTLAFSIEQILSRLDSLDARVAQQETDLLDGVKRLDSILTTHHNILKDTSELRSIAHSLRKRFASFTSREFDKKASERNN